MSFNIFRRPILGHYYITERCNGSCIYCDIPRQAGQVHAIDANLSEVEENLFHLKKLGVRFIDFTGGEPLLHPALPQMLQLAKRLKFNTTVTTNCLLYPKRAAEIRGLIDFLHFSLDSMDEKTNDRLRGRGSYRAVMESIELARRLGEKPDLLFTVTDENVDSIGKLIHFAQQKKLMLIVNPVFVYQNQQPVSTGALRKLNAFYGSRYVYFNKTQHRLIQNEGNQIASPRCRVGQAVVVISPQNELLLPCYHRVRRRIKIDKNLSELWHASNVQKYRSLSGKFPFCQGCTINCYFDPSFLYEVDDYFWLSLVSKARYAFDKYIRAKLR